MWSGLFAVVITAVVAVVSHLATKKYLAVKIKAQIAADLLRIGVEALRDDLLTREELTNLAALARRLVD